MIIHAISDTHGHLLPHESIGPCNILLHAGDICPDQVEGRWTRRNPNLAAQWFKRTFMDWLQPMLESGQVGSFVGTWGNHDWTEYSTVDLELPPNVHMEVDTLVEVDGVKIWLSPWSNEFCGWAWMKDPKILGEHYKNIPKDIDILVSHQPPYMYGDMIPAHYVGTRNTEHVGSKELFWAIGQVAPKAVVCGHIHNGRGHYNFNGIHIDNVSCVDEQYKVIAGSTDIFI